MQPLPVEELRLKREKKLKLRPLELNVNMLSRKGYIFMPVNLNGSK